MPSRTAIPQIKSYDDIFTPTATDGFAQVGQVVEMPLELLYEPEYSPFQVRDDALMRATAASVEENGVLVPGIVRPRADVGFEVVAGRRRKLACELAERRTMPVIIRELCDDDAVIVMVDSNLQREELLPSERGWAFRMKLEVLNHRGSRAQVGEIPIGKLSVDVIAEEYKGKRGFSKTNIYRYVRLTELVPALLDMVDEGKIAPDPASLLSYLSRVEQAQLLDAMAMHEAIPSPSQAKRLKELSEAGELTIELMDAIMGEEKKSEVKVTLTAKKLGQYFPQDFTQQQMEAVIIALLDGWKADQSGMKMAV